MTERLKKSLMVGIVVVWACVMAWMAFFVVSELIHFAEDMNHASSFGWPVAKVIALAGLGLSLVLSGNHSFL